jgi:hypothetical protein
MSVAMNHELNLHIILQNPPPGVDFALQKGSGNNFETVQQQRSSAGDLHFECTVKVTGDKKEEPNFLGPFVQGPKGERFIYIGIGTFAGVQNAAWQRRLKIPLRDISWKTIAQILAKPGLILTTQVPGTGKDGTPNCATVKPFSGWKLPK